jgi:hypothetical protein
MSGFKARPIIENCDLTSLRTAVRTEVADSRIYSSMKDGISVRTVEQMATFLRLAKSWVGQSQVTVKPWDSLGAHEARSGG